MDESVRLMQSSHRAGCTHDVSPKVPDVILAVRVAPGLTQGLIGEPGRQVTPAVGGR